MNIDNPIQAIVKTLIEDISVKVQKEVFDTIQKEVRDAISKIDMVALFNASFSTSLKNQTFEFPERSIPMTAVDLNSLQLSGDRVSGGIIKNFGSTGIDDQATDCRLSIFDDLTVVENNLVTKDLTVKGTTTIEGDLNVTGTVPESSSMYVSLVRSVTDRVKTELDDVVFDHYAGKIYRKISEEGIDLSKITLNGTELIDGGNLSSSVTFSNLQRVGTLSELRVSGEALLSQTLYTTTKRVGVNTTEPAQALSVWDQEIEIGFGKRENNVAVIEAPRNQKLILGANGKNNIVLNTDGSISTNSIGIGTITLSTGSTPPTKDAPQGSIVFNTNPTLGSPLGWVSLGGARWANFGFVD
jgi:DNA polymerase III epsilon subunit-like protein